MFHPFVQLPDPHPAEKNESKGDGPEKWSGTNGMKREVETGRRE